MKGYFETTLSTLNELRWLKTIKFVAVQKWNKSDGEKKEKAAITLPVVPPEVMRTVSERHNKGLMSPCIYQILTQVTLS